MCAWIVVVFPIVKKKKREEEKIEWKKKYWKKKKKIGDTLIRCWKKEISDFIVELCCKEKERCGEIDEKRAHIVKLALSYVVICLFSDTGLFYPSPATFSLPNAITGIKSPIWS